VDFSYNPEENFVLFARTNKDANVLVKDLNERNARKRLLDFWQPIRLP